VRACVRARHSIAFAWHGRGGDLHTTYYERAFPTTLSSPPAPVTGAANCALTGLNLNADMQGLAVGKSQPEWPAALGLPIRVALFAQHMPGYTVCHAKRTITLVSRQRFPMYLSNFFSCPSRSVTGLCLCRPRLREGGSSCVFRPIPCPPPSPFHRP
jgi:hypothetical protein